MSAAAPTAGYRLAKFARRNRAVLATAGVLLLCLAGGATLSTWEAVRATRAEQSATLALRSAQDAGAATEAARQKLEASLYASRVATACQAWEKGDVPEAERLLDLCPPELRAWEWHYLKRQCHQELARFYLVEADSALRAGEFGPLGGGHVHDFRAKLAFLSRGDQLVAQLADGPALRFDLTSGSSLPWDWIHATNAELALSAAGSRLIATSNPGASVEVLDLERSESFRVAGEVVELDHLCSEGGGWLARRATNGVEIIELARPSIRRWIGMTNCHGLHALSSDGATLVAELHPGYGVWDTVSGRLRFRIEVPAYPHAFRLDPRGQFLAVCGPQEPDYEERGFSVAVWDLAKGQRVFVRSDPSLNSMTRAWFAPRDRWLVFTSNGYLDWHPANELTIVDLATGQEVLALAADNMAHHVGRAMWFGKPGGGGAYLPIAGINDVALSPDGNLLALAVCDRTVQVIALGPTPDQPESGRRPFGRTLLRGHRGAVLAVNFSPDGKRLASVDQAGEVRIRDPAGQTPLALGRDWESFSSVSPGGTKVIWAPPRKRNEVQMVDLVTGVRRRFPEFQSHYDFRVVRWLDDLRVLGGAGSGMRKREPRFGRSTRTATSNTLRARTTAGVRRWSASA